MKSVINKKFKVLNISHPFRYLLIENFLDLDYLRKINNYFDKVPSTLYVRESVPQTTIQKLDIYN